MKPHTLASLSALALGAVLLGCTSSSGSGGSMSSSAATASPSASVTQGWRNLIDPTMSAWRGYKETTVPAGWHVADGVLSKTESVNDLVTRDQFANFELEFEW